MSVAEKFEIIADEVYDKAVIDKDEQIWKSMTMNGTRDNFSYFLAYSDWSGYRFIKPIKPTRAINHFFYSTTMTEIPGNIDFSEILSGESADIYGYRRDLCSYSKRLEVFPDMNMRAIGGLEQWFNYCWRLHTVELLRVNRATIYNNTFGQCSKLTNINFDGEIGKTISFKDSPLLSVASMKNIITHLADYSDSNEADVNILTFHDNCWTALEASGKPSDDGISFSGTWREYVSALAWET